jgi:hypothetical protein
MYLSSLPSSEITEEMSLSVLPENTEGMYLYILPKSQKDMYLKLLGMVKVDDSDLI